MALMGHLKTVQITTVLQMLCDENKTGVLRAQYNNEQVKFFIQDGYILCVMGSLKRAWLGNLLRNSNLISSENLEKCLMLAKKKNQALGKILIDEGYITDEKLAAVVNKQAEEIITNLLSWEGGSFEYNDGKINLKDMVITPINVMGLILEALRRKDEMKISKDESNSKEKPECNPIKSSEQVNIKFTEGEVDCNDEKIPLESNENTEKNNDIELSKEEWETFLEWYSEHQK